MKPRCAVLDDYQGAALTSADWSPLADRIDVRVLREHLTDRDALVAAVEDCEILVVMRERTPVDAALLDRLPQLRLLVTALRNSPAEVSAGGLLVGPDDELARAREAWRSALLERGILPFLRDVLAATAPPPGPRAPETPPTSPTP